MKIASSDPTRTVLAPVEHLDLSTVLKLSQAVQSETDLDELIAAVMRLGLEHAGAERGLLLLPHGDGYRIEAEARSSNEGVTVARRQSSIGPVICHSPFSSMFSARASASSCRMPSQRANSPTTSTCATTTRGPCCASRCSSKRG